MNSIKLVNNTGVDIRMFEDILCAAVDSKEPLPEEIADVFKLTILQGFNADGTDRGIVDFI